MTVWPAREHSPSVEVPPRLRQTFRRGFVEVVRCRLEDWMTYGRNLVRAHPVLEVEVLGANGAGPFLDENHARAWLSARLIAWAEGA